MARTRGGVNGRPCLEAVACGLTHTPADIKRYIQCTLLNALNDFQDVVAKGATEALKWLQREGFLAWDPVASQWQPQPLGRAAASTHLDPLGATAVIDDVRKARRCLILESDLHLLFLCVPPDPPAVMDLEEAAAADTKKKMEITITSAAASAAAAAAAVAVAVKREQALPGGTASTGPPAPGTTNTGGGGGGGAVKDNGCWLKPHIFTRIYNKLSTHEQNVARLDWRGTERTRRRSTGGCAECVTASYRR